MMTILRIPFARAPEDPTWMSKVRAGKKLNPIEANMYYKSIFEEETKGLHKITSFDGVPSTS